MHRTRRMVVGRVQCGEVKEVVLDLGTIGHFEADRAEEAFDALQRARHRMQTATEFAAAGQCHVERLFGQAGFQRGELDRVARALSAADRFLARLMAAPAVFFSSGGSLPRPFRSSVIWPDLPGKRALTCSSSSGLLVAANARLASLIIASRFCIWILYSPKPGACASFSPLWGQASRLCLSHQGCEAGLGLVRNGSERRLVENGQIRQHLAVDFDLRLLQPVHERAVLQPSSRAPALIRAITANGTDACL